MQLLRELPPGARTWLAMGHQDGLWGLTEHLQAITVDELRIGNWQRANEGRKKSEQTRAPDPFPRPGTPAAARNSPERVKAREAARAEALERARVRRAAIASGAIT